MNYAQHKNKSESYLRAKKLRRNGSPIERLLRNALRIQLKSYEFIFRYQYPIDPYVVDFICLPARLIIEIDGMSHDAQVSHDAKRQTYLENQGFHVVHFTNADVIKSPAAVALSICERAKELIELNRKETHPRAG